MGLEEDLVWLEGWERGFFKSPGGRGAGEDGEVSGRIGENVLVRLGGSRHSHESARSIERF